MSEVAVAEEIQNRTPAGATQMWKFHASLNVSDLERSLAFYAALLGAPPVKAYEDYAKFEIDHPPLVLSLKPKRACAGGPLNHLGLRVQSISELEAIHERMKAVQARIGQQDDVQCCYARQSKLWITDPDQTLWEVYVFHEDVPDWGEKNNLPKLWKAPLKAFGMRGMIGRLWNNRFGARPVKPNGRLIPPEEEAGSLTAANGSSHSPIPDDTCPVPPAGSRE